jgi:nucleoside 2-deoxyribosyltransferase
MIIYLAGPIFSLAERRFNEALCEQIRLAAPHIEVILPQERAKAHIGAADQNRHIFDECVRGLEECDAVVAILDGPDADSGTCVELGLAFAMKKPILGLRTDFRISEERGLNLMVAFVCDDLVLAPNADVQSLAAEAVGYCASLPTEEQERRAAIA